MTFDSLYQVESYAEELRAGYGDALEYAIEAARAVRNSNPGEGYWRGAKCAVAAIEALRQEGA